MEQIGVGQIATDEGQRIIFVEPNDVYDKNADNAQKGLSLTPRYEDFCISFNLIIEAFSRFKSSGTSVDKNGNKSEDGNVRKYVIEWGMTKEEMKKRRTSVLQGDRGDGVLNAEDGSFDYSNSNYNYLTTYYTDITFDSYKKKTQIEGLGVESVQISYESWYTPTVTIKFVDVRGSALFGREEAIHIDEQLTAENIFGAFFTMPYPLFRLQVKGFLGKPVTYQLTCSNFKGEFNTQTGNFEAVATFIGYSWSLLTDIPFTYLVSAPNATYVGMDYWERHKNTSEWGLWDDGEKTIPPPKLDELFTWIEQADKRISTMVKTLTESQSTSVQTLETEEGVLNEIKIHLKGFMDSLVSCVDSKYMGVFFDDETKTQQMLFFSNSESVTIKEETIKKYEDLYKAIEKYAISYSENGLTITKAPNGWKECPKTITFLDKFNVVSNTNGVTESIDVKELPSLTSDGLKNIVFNDKNGKLTHKASEELYKAITGSYKNNNIRKYVYLVDFSNITDIVNGRISVMTKEKEKFAKEINEKINYQIKSIVGFKPFIGNVFKIIFCHLETFCHIMFEAAQEIYDQTERGERTPSYLGININNTDVINNVNKNVTPWPALYDNGYKTQECGYTSEIENVYGWVGDLNHNFVEEKVVYTFQEGIQNIVDKAQVKTTIINKIDYFPLIPSDLIYGSPFAMTSIGNVSDLAGFLALRFAAICGVLVPRDYLKNNAIEMLGRLDCYNFYSTSKGIGMFKTLFTDKTVEDFKGIVFCDEKYDKLAYGVNEGTNKRYHMFETTKNIFSEYNKQRRHAMFSKTKDEKIMFFCHWYDKKGNEFVPSNLKNFIDYKDDISSLNNGEYDIFIPNFNKLDNKHVSSMDWLYNCPSNELPFLKPEDYEKYINKYMFSIISDDSLVTSLTSRLEEIYKGNCKILDYEVKDDLRGYLGLFYLHTLGNDEYYKDVCYMLSGNLKSLKIEPSGLNLLGNTKKTEEKKDDKEGDKKEEKSNILNTMAHTFDKFFDKLDVYTWDVTLSKNDLKNEVTFQEMISEKSGITKDFKFNQNAVSLNDVVVQQFKMLQFLGEECNLFGNPFYYMQNEKLSSETDEEYKDRCLKVKALLFLHTFKYDYFNTNLEVFNIKHPLGGVERVPKAYLLFLAAMLWRKRYAEKHGGKDPIIYSSSQDTDKYKSPTVDGTFFVYYTSGSSKTLCPSTMRENDNTASYSYKVSNLFAGITKVDYNIENQMIEFFENFVTTTFTKIAERYELKYSPTVGNVTRALNSRDIKNVVNNIQLYYTQKGTTVDLKTWIKDKAHVVFTDGYVSVGIVPDKPLQNQGLKLLMNENDKEMQNMFKDLYLNSYLVCNSCYRTPSKVYVDDIGTSGVIGLSVDDYESYINGFLKAANDIIKTKTTSTGGDNNFQLSEKLIKNRDLSVAIYYYLKNLWDKWLVIAETDAFDVANYFTKNFIFTDSFYNNTYNKLAINCQLLLKAWIELADNGSLFSFISRVVTDHTCIFLPVPDYVGFNGKSQKHDIEMMEDLFRPLPYNSMEAPSNSNKFVVMYTHSPSSVKDEGNGFKTDSYDIWSHAIGENGGFTEEAKTLFSTTNSTDFNRDTDAITREGYNVPSFGVCFGRQNNHIFKNLKLTMDNPVMTEQSINALWNIAKMGSGGGRKVNFVGQDTFNVFSNYSYSVEVEMMGNAQICPLMYFQLMNVPMWRGTYMIYKVTHNMRAGDMTTSITGMKMSKFSKPFNSTFFVYNPNAKTEEELKGGDSSCGGETNSGTSTSPGVIEGTYGKPGCFTGKSRAEKLKMCGGLSNSIGPGQAMSSGLITNVTFNQTGGTKTLQMNKYIADDFKAICNEILALGWFKLNVGNCYRTQNSVSSGMSRHCWGIAVDINPGNGGNPWFAHRCEKGASEPAQGSSAPWKAKKCPYSGTYDRAKCIWHWGHPVVKIFLAHGWGWGGSYGDVMHFSVDDGH